MKRVTLRKFAALAKDQQTDDLIVYRQCPAIITRGPEGERRLSLTISTAGQDREGDTIALDGWKLEAYARNPVVLWAHDYRSLPIARAAKTRIEDGVLKADAVFPPAEMHPFSAKIYDLAAAGFINASSVGFIPQKWSFRKDGGIDFHEQELIEFSFVTVPANADALIDGRSQDEMIETGLLPQSDALIIEGRGRRRRKPKNDYVESGVEWIPEVTETIAEYTREMIQDTGRRLAADEEIARYRQILTDLVNPAR